LPVELAEPVETAAFAEPVELAGQALVASFAEFAATAATHCYLRLLR